eukprot:3082250-Amphidinium_carterae.1
MPKHSGALPGSPISDSHWTLVPPDLPLSHGILAYLFWARWSRLMATITLPFSTLSHERGRNSGSSADYCLTVDLVFDTAAGFLTWWSLQA